MKKIYCWNVNGIRAVYKKGFIDWVLSEAPDILCLQEIKAYPDQLPAELNGLPGYQSVWNPAQRKGYSGVAVYYRQPPLNVGYGLGIDRFDREGRLLVMEYPDFTLLNVYFPNGGMGDERVQYKLEFYQEIIEYCDGLRNKDKKVIICGDFNTAHREIDLKNPKNNMNTSGFLLAEREMLDEFLSRGYIDVFRHLYPDKVEYTWWDFRTRARERNAGWRIDCFYVSSNMIDSVADCVHFGQVYGSDHCPLGLYLPEDMTEGYL
ncbi:MAG: exodeoxyribonuclease III [Syntrophomonadaceae bacterium]|nr:exodeoxyribonuclease III [Syntrophomonadaceae bacterium]